MSAAVFTWSAVMAIIFAVALVALGRWARRHGHNVVEVLGFGLAALLGLTSIASTVALFQKGYGPWDHGTPTATAEPTTTHQPSPTSTDLMPTLSLSNSPSTPLSTPPSTNDKRGQEQYIHQMRIVDRSRFGQIFAGSGSFSVDGKAYPRSVVFYNLCNNNDGGDIWAEYNLGREYRWLVATVGISDENPTGASGTFRILADGTEVASGKLDHGGSVPVKIEVTNVLRLRLEVNNPSAAASCARKATPFHTVWGDALLT